MVNYHSCCIPNYSGLRQPMTELHKDKSRKFGLKQAIDAFDKIKHALSNATTLSHLKTDVDTTPMLNR